MSMAGLRKRAGVFVCTVQRVVIYLNQHDIRDMDSMTTEHLDLYQD